jgi:hypothetical protein
MNPGADQRKDGHGMETSPTMGRAELGRLSAAWRGEASDFTPLLNQQLDVLGEAIGIDLVSVGKTEVATDGGRRIDIVASADDGAEFVIENQYGRANHDHLTRGLAYAVARRARGLIVVAEEHRDEFRAVAQYLNELGELEPTKGIAVWLVEAKAIRIGDSPWAPLFAAVVEPNRFTASIEEAKQRERRLPTADAFWAQFTEPALLKAAQAVISAWEDRGRRWRLGPDHVVLMGVGPAAGGLHSVIRIYADGGVAIPFAAYRGKSTGLPIPALTSPPFLEDSRALFGLAPQKNRTNPGWLRPDRVEKLIEFCDSVAAALEAQREAAP